MRGIYVANYSFLNPCVHCPVEQDGMVLEVNRFCDFSTPIAQERFKIRPTPSHKLVLYLPPEPTGLCIKNLMGYSDL